MGGNYGKSVYNQLMEVMARLDSVEKDLKEEKIEHKKDVNYLNAKINNLAQENSLLSDRNACLKSIINNDSSNSSLPPFSDQKAENLQIHITEGIKQDAKQADRKDIRADQLVVATDVG